MKRIYLDNSATSMVSKEALDAMLPYFSDKYGNASSLHSMGQEAHDAVETARAQVARAVNADAAEIVFTSGGTESDNLAILGTAMMNKKKGEHLITSSIEHVAVLETFKALEKEGFKVTYLPVDKDGIVSLSDVEAAIRPDTTLISVMHVNNEIGTVQPVKEIGDIAQRKGITFHTDAVQSLGKVKVDVKDMGVNLLALSGHKFHGPKGVGVLYMKKGTKVKPLMYGGGHERGVRSGTENVAGIAGTGKAAEVAARDIDKNAAYMTRLRDRLIEGLLNVEDTRLNGHRMKRSPNNVNVTFDYVEGESLLLMLDMDGIEVSTGSACSSKKLMASHVLLALGLKPEDAHGSLRLTCSEYNTLEEIEYVIETVPKHVARLREMSPISRARPTGESAPTCIPQK